MKFVKRNTTKGSEGSNVTIKSYSNSSSSSSSSLTSHNIWGQPFDGTNDVTGDMQNVGSITATGNIQTDGDIIIKQLDTDGNEVEGGDLTMSVENADAQFSGKENYIFDGKIKGNSAEITNNIEVGGKGSFDSDLTVKGISKLKDVTSNNISNADTIRTKNLESYGNSTLNDVTSNNITNSDTIKTKNLEVTGSAHFFELIIDKIKAAGGAALFTPADGFDIDIVEANGTSGYKLYWQCQDGNGKQRDNMWKVNDQALCMSFNQAKVGTSHSVNNKYYWCLVTDVSDSSNPTLIDGEYYNYIVISSTVCDGTVNPEKGDSIVMCGYRGTDDAARQSAIYISAYSSLDNGLTAPLLAQYKGINDFNLESHRNSYYDAVSAKFIGEFEVSNGQNIEDFINDKIKVVDDKYSSLSATVDGINTKVVNNTTSITKLGENLETANNNITALETTVSNNYSTLDQKADGISAKVSENTTTINNINGQVTTNKTNIANLSVKADGIESTVSNYMQPNKNYFGFCKDINWSTMGISTIPLINTYGVEVRSIDRSFGRISNLGFYGQGGYFVVSGTIRMTKASNNNINLNLCDVEPYKIEFYNTTGNCLNVAAYSQKFVCYYNIPDNSYTDVDTYNGFLDIEGVVKDSGNHCIIENLKIERGVQPTQFCIADEDNNNVPIVLKQYGDWAISNAVTKDNNTKEYTPNNKPEEGSYIDYIYFNDITVKNHQCYTLTFDAYTDTNGVVLSSYLYGNGGIINSDGVYKTYNDGNTETTLITSQLNNGFKRYYVHWYVDIDGINGATLVKNCIPVRLAYSETNNKANLKFKNVTLYEGYVSDSVIQQTRSQIKQTAESITSTINNTGDNLFTGIGNGLYWTGYTLFDVNGYTFYFNPSNYLVSPVVQDYIGTYTLSFGWVCYPVKVEIFEFTTMYNLGDTPDFSTGNKIAEISTDDIDNYDTTKMHKDATLDRYYYTFSESTSSSKSFRMRFSTTNQNSVIQKIQIEAGTIPHAFNESYASNQSQIKQTADAIELKVNDVSLKLSDGNITLNGNTKVNGSLTLNDDKQGFLLLGNGGTTEISPKSIGSYSAFKDRTSNTIRTHYLSDIHGELNIDTNTYEFFWSVTQNIGTYKKGDYIKLINYTNDVVTNVGTDIGTPYAKFYINENGTQTKAIDLGVKNYVDIDYYTVVNDNADIQVTGQFTIYAPKSIWSTSRGIDTNLPNTPFISVTVEWDNEVPNKNSFMLIGYDGFGVNFGTNKTVYCGAEGFIASYGDSLFKITSDGIVEKKNSASVAIVNGSSSINSPSHYYLKEGVDTILCKSGYTIITLPSEPYQGQSVKIFDKSPQETWVNFQGYIVGANSAYDSRTYQTKLALDGTAVRAFTFIGDTWFMEYMG